MLFALVAYDRPGAVPSRADLRPDHLKHLDSLGDQLVLAGPFLDEAGNMVGSIVVVEAPALSDAKVILDRDPFMTGGLFDSVTVKPWRIGVNKTPR